MQSTKEISSEGHDFIQPLQDSALQSGTGKYRVSQENPCNEHRFTAMRTVFPAMKTGFSL